MSADVVFYKRDRLIYSKCFFEAEFISSVIAAYSLNGMTNSAAQPVQQEKITLEG